MHTYVHQFLFLLQLFVFLCLKIFLFNFLVLSCSKHRMTAFCWNYWYQRLDLTCFRYHIICSYFHKSINSPFCAMCYLLEIKALYFPGCCLFKNGQQFQTAKIGLWAYLTDCYFKNVVKLWSGYIKIFANIRFSKRMSRFSQKPFSLIRN